uniref:C-X-C motif chemokine n=1 Tax=Piliocolobus tephrosceles TaxID=591936 RepID=A0A8C9H6Z3_9PRIM
MSLQSSRAARVPGPSGSLCALLALLLLLTPPGPLVSGESAWHWGRTRAQRCIPAFAGRCVSGNSSSNLPYKNVCLSSPAGPVSAVLTELRCTCLHFTPRVNPKMIGKLQVFPVGPQCSKVEVIASLKNGKQVCLDPEAPFLKRSIQKILDSGKQEKLSKRKDHTW